MGCGGAECLKFSEYDINSSDEDFSGRAEDNSNVVRTRRQSILLLSGQKQTFHDELIWPVSGHLGEH